MRSRRALRRWISIALCALALPSCADRAGCPSDTVSNEGGPILVLAAFPGELAALLAHAQVTEEIPLGALVLRPATLGGVPVVVGMTGIGLANASRTTREAVRLFTPRGIVMAGVAGSPHRIGDVTVPEAWQLAGEGVYPVDAAWLELARAVAAPGGVVLERCTAVPPEVASGIVCMPEPLAVWVGGVGQSSDPFVGGAPECSPDGHPVFGCDAGGASSAALGSGDARAASSASDRAALRVAADATLPARPAQDDFVAVDMETAAVAQVAAEHGLRFIAFRAVSDGANDPLGLPGFPAQFFAYYPLAARNAAAAVAAFLARLGACS